MMKKIILLVLAVILAAGPAACGQAEPDYFGAGIEVTKLMGEMAGSEEFIAFFFNDPAMISLGQAFSADDYDRPAAVYSVKFRDEAYTVYRMLAALEDDKWNRLTEELREQLRARITVQAYCQATVNGKAGTDYLAFSSVITAAVKNEGLPGGETVCYLYTFEKGTPILVTFGYHTAAGAFVLLTKEQTATLSGLCGAMPELEINPLERP